MHPDKKALFQVYIINNIINFLLFPGDRQMPVTPISLKKIKEIIKHEK